MSFFFPNLPGGLFCSLLRFLACRKRIQSDGHGLQSTAKQEQSHVFQ
jgi:hypothetical protein